MLVYCDLCFETHHISLVVLSCFGFLSAINFKLSIPVSFPSCQRNSAQKMTFHFLGYRDYTHETRNYHLFA